jgi:hypothetical protein
MGRNGWARASDPACWASSPRNGEVFVSGTP